MHDNSSRPLLILVEDDHAVLTSLSFALEAEGFPVAGFGSAEDLLRSGISLAGACVVADHVLPGMTGLDLLEQLRMRDPKQKAVLTVSTLTPIVERRATRTGVQVIEKPLLGSSLFDAIKAA